MMQGLQQQALVIVCHALPWLEPNGKKVMQLFIDFARMTRVFAAAAEQGRFQLFEHETYELLSALGSESVPEHLLLPRTHRLTAEMLAQFLEDRVVLKIVSEDIVHKSDVGGVRVVPRLAGKVRSESRRMIDRVSTEFTRYLETHPDHHLAAYEGLQGRALQEAVNKRIQGVLLTQFLPPDSESLGHELLVSLRWTREFGMVITAGLGGTDTELYAERFRQGQAVVSASTADVSGEAYFALFTRTIAYEKISGQTRGGKRLVSDEQLLECFGAFIAVGNYFSPLNPTAPFVIEELEVNPFAFVDYEMVPLDGLCRFTPTFRPKASRGVERIGNLLLPKQVAIVGASATKMNFGRNILHNMLLADFPSDQLTLVSSSALEIEGVRCVPTLEELQEIDLLILAVGAGQIPGMVETIVSHQLARSVILISGGLGETEESQETAAQLVETIRRGHADGKGPVFLGGNCMGLVSRPGQVDSFFTPEACSPKRRALPPAPVALVSQSGAFALVRMTDFVAGDPAYNITVGNQIDLTIGDCITWLADAPDVGVICVYAEGFQDLDGLHACRGIRRAIAQGKEVLVFKAGRTPEGKKATSGHTASVAGDYLVCTSCLRQAGALVAESLEEFDGLMNLAVALHGKPVTGGRIAAMSPAGFECVSIADSLETEGSLLSLPEFSPETRALISGLFEQAGLAGIMDVKNPLDLTPAGPDQLYVEVIKALLADEAIDVVVSSLGSLAPATSDTPDSSAAAGYVTSAQSLASQLPRLQQQAGKPLLVFNNAGRAHEPINNALRAQGVSVYATPGQVMTLLGNYIAYRQRIATMA